MQNYIVPRAKTYHNCVKTYQIKCFFIAEKKVKANH